MREVNLQDVPWPTFTEAQVRFLEKLYPPRCIERTETIEDHIRLAGKVDLIAQMRDHVIGSIGLAFSADEEDALDDMAERIALASPQEQKQEE